MVSEVKNQDLPVKLFRLEANQGQSQMVTMVVTNQEVTAERNTMFQMIEKRLNN